MLSGEATAGTFTFLFTDIEGSTKLWEAFPSVMGGALARHDALMRSAIETAGGQVFKTVGDAFCAAFPSAQEAIEAATQAQRALGQATWPETISIKVRMAIHTGSAECRDNDFFGPTLNRVARILSTGHGGQVLLSQATYAIVRDSLPPETTVREMGEHRLKDLGQPEIIHQLVRPGLEIEFPPLRSLSTPRLRHNLPQQVTSFIGRERELAEVDELLGRARVLTLTGAGGSGKTRLSLQTAAERIERFEDGVWLVELAHLDDPQFVPQALASVLGIKEEQGKPVVATLTDDLRAKSSLIILDNCEHVLDATARLADTLIRSCPRVQILASSREALGIAGEQAYRVPSLSRPDPTKPQTPASLSQYEAVQLFIERALLALPSFEVTAENAQALASLCFHLDGIPLAIELAAARVRSLSVEEIDGKLDQRFRLLTGGSRTALPRQQTLRALVAWSFDLLNDMEREAIEQLSVFVGGWNLPMAERVCGDPIDEFDLLDLLTTLVDKSLVNVDRGASARYSTYESIREYARGQLDARPEVAQAVIERHAETMAKVASDLTRKLRTTEEPAALQALLRDTPNLKAALATARATGRMDAWARVALALAASDQRRGFPRDAITLVDDVLSCSPSMDSEVRARLLCERATLCLDVLDHEAAGPAAVAAREAAGQIGSVDLTIRAENLLGQVAMAHDDFAATRSHYQEALTLAEGTRNWVEMARLRNNLGIVERRDPDGNKDLAAAHYEAALAIQREHRHARGEAETLNSLGVLAQSRGQLDEAAKHYLAAARIESELEHPFGVAKTLSNYGEVMIEGENHAGALWPLCIAEALFAQVHSPYREYSQSMLQQASGPAGIEPSALETMRATAARLELKDAVAVSLQGI